MKIIECIKGGQYCDGYRLSKKCLSSNNRGVQMNNTTISLPLFSGLLASLNAATVFAPEDIPTCNQ